jgi:hypothetical protein
VTPIINPAKKCPQISPTKIHQKGSENHRKRKNGIHKQITKGHKDELQTFYTSEERFFTKRLATSHHPTHLKIFLEAQASHRSEEERGKRQRSK